MHAIDRLRHIARSGEIDANELASEAAYALAGLASEPFTLVPACQRLLDFHPACAPLWWVASHMLGATDIHDEAYRLIDALESDPTAAELAVSFDSGARVVADARRTVLRALAARPDLEVALVGAHYDLRRGMRLLGDLVIPPLGLVAEDLDDEFEVMASDGGRAPVVVIEAVAAGPDGILVTGVSQEIAAASARAGLPIDVVAGVGRVLPTPLFSAMVSRLSQSAAGSVTRRPQIARPSGYGWDDAELLADEDPPDCSVLGVDDVRFLVEPTGRRLARLALRRVGGPAPSELCRLR